MVNPLKRLQEVEQLLEQKLYFTLHAPRQTGKTTYLHAISQQLNAAGKYIAVVASVESAGVASIPLPQANEIIIDSIYDAACDQLPQHFRPEKPSDKQSPNLKKFLRSWAKSQSLPIVLFFDEIDALINDVLISVLRQLRDGYQSRPENFPSSVVLVGVRDVREYKAQITQGRRSLGTASPFNIKSDSLILGNFSKEEVFELLDQHGHETGQVFPLEVKEEIFRLGKGQPWLTNALARQIVTWILRDNYSLPITMDILQQACQELITRRDTHLDSLADKLREERIKRIIHAIIIGDNRPFDIYDDDIAYARDLGIVTSTSPLKFSNPIYAEIITRIMASPIQESLPEEIQTPWFIDDRGALDMEKLLQEFQKFYRRNSDAWIGRYQYKESAHHLLLMAFLQRIVNSGGEMIREMAAGNGRLDILIKFRHEEFALELKIKRDRYTIEDGKEQLARYLDRLGLKKGWLIIFDPADLPWEEKLYRQETAYQDKTLILVGL